LEYRILGDTDVLVSRLGYGCAQFSGYDYGDVDEAELTRTVRSAWDQGITFFDVADVYGFGQAEELLSKALGKARNQAVMATKCGLAWTKDGKVRHDGSAVHIRRSVEASLRRLGCDAIPLLQLHWPDASIPLSETLGEMDRLRREGKVQHIGVSNFSTRMLRDAISVTRIESVQVPYNLLCRQVEAESLELCNHHRISVFAHSGLARGFLTGRFGARPGFGGNDTRNTSLYFSARGIEDKQRLLDGISEIAQRRDRSCSAVSLRWILHEERVTSVLAGMKTVVQLDQNLGATGWKLDSHEFRGLSKLSAACDGSLTGELSGTESQHEVASHGN